MLQLIEYPTPINQIYKPAVYNWIYFGIPPKQNRPPANCNKNCAQNSSHDELNGNGSVNYLIPTIAIETIHAKLMAATESSRFCG